MKSSILILGAGRGLGRELCRFFLEEGHSVIGVTRTQESLTTALDDFSLRKQLFRGEAIDLSDRESSLRFLHGQNKELVPDLVVYAAGYLSERKPLWDLSWEEIDREISSNFSGPLLWSVEMTRAFLNAKRGGHLFFSSGVVRLPRPSWGSYGVGKAAVEALSKQISLDLPQPLYSLSINPGRMATTMRKVAFPDEDQATLPSPASIAKKIGAFCLTLIEGAGRTYNGKALTMEDIP
jgi:NAD(P)-dependent dehydrogenase (short-subunit alcohol dehydrogenase family)